MTRTDGQQVTLSCHFVFLMDFCPQTNFLSKNGQTGRANAFADPEVAQQVGHHLGGNCKAPAEGKCLRKEEVMFLQAK